MHCVIEYSDPLHREAVIRLWQRVFNDDAPHNRPDRSIDKKLMAADRLFFVVMLDNQVAGTVLAGYDGHRGWLYSVAVDPQFREKGLGTALVRHAEQALVERGCMKINLQIRISNEGVQAFYQAMGYIQEPLISMGKRIASTLDSRP